MPPDGWQRTVLQEPHSTTVCACEKTCEGEGEGVRGVRGVGRGGGRVGWRSLCKG